VAEIALEPLDAPIGQNDTMNGEPPGIQPERAPRAEAVIWIFLLTL